jgi:hypothetical protein
VVDEVQDLLVLMRDGGLQSANALAAAVRDPAEFLDVDVDHRARAVALVADV